MPLNAKHLRDYVVRPALQHVGLWSEPAERLVMGTAAQESGLEALHQIGGGPALGLWQMESETHDDIWENYLAFRAALARRVLTLAPFCGQQIRPNADTLIGNLYYAAVMCRLKYLRDPAPLPDKQDIAGMAATWLRAYNWGGKGTAEAFWKAYRRLILPIYEER